MILRFTRHPNRHRLAPMRLNFVFRCKNSVCDVSIHQRVWLLCADTVNPFAAILKQTSSFVTLNDRIKTQIPIVCFLNRGLR